MRHLDPTRNTRCKDRSRTLKSDIDLYLTARKYYLSRNTNALRECLNSFETAHVARNARRLMKHELAPCFDELLASEAFRHNFLLRSVHKLLNPFYFEVRFYLVTHIVIAIKLLSRKASSKLCALYTTNLETHLAESCTA